jgi:hypothetical protein
MIPSLWLKRAFSHPRCFFYVKSANGNADDYRGAVQIPCGRDSAFLLIYFLRRSSIYFVGKEGRVEHQQVYRSFVSYIDRTREYYAAQGYSKPYAWPRYDDVPFAPLRKSLSDCRIGLVTTAGKPQAKVKTDSLGLGLTVRQLYAEPTYPPPTRLFTADLGWHKAATHTEDIDSYLPINRLSELVTEGHAGSMSPRFYGVPTDYSQKRTLERYAPQILQWCREDGVNAVLLSAL